MWTCPRKPDWNSRKKGLMGNNGKVIHTKVLVPSDLDMVTLVDAVEARFLRLLEEHQRIRGTELYPPKDLDADMLLWRTLHARHVKRDFRHTDDEKKAVRRVAEWTLQENCKLRNQVYKPVEWKD